MYFPAASRTKLDPMRDSVRDSMRDSMQDSIKEFSGSQVSEDVKMWRCGDVGMWGCEDVKMWRCKDVILSISDKMLCYHQIRANINNSLLMELLTSCKIIPDEEPKEPLNHMLGGLLHGGTWYDAKPL